MAQMTLRSFTAGLLAAALAFKAIEEAEVEKERLRTAVEGTEPDPPEEYDEEDLWEKFQSFIEENGVADKPSSEMLTIAGLHLGEPSFTLRGQDLLSSMLVRHWIALYGALAPDVNQDKIDGAETIAEKMEMYSKQQWAD